MKKRPKAQRALTAQESKEANRLTHKLTAFGSFESLVRYYQTLPGGYRAKNCRLNPALLAKWIQSDQALEIAEHRLQLALAHLVDRASGLEGPSKRIIVISPVKRAA